MKVFARALTIDEEDMFHDALNSATLSICAGCRADKIPERFNPPVDLNDVLTASMPGLPR
jgi:hypothetical protein